MNSVVDLNEVVDEWELDSSTVKPLEPLIFKFDPVACACASYRLWKSNPQGPIRWHDLNTITPAAEDVEQANQLKHYYRNHLVIESLKQTTVGSEFRRKLALLVINELPITKREIGMLLRLPYFYQEDLDLDAVVAETNCEIKSTLPGPVAAYNYTLIPIKRILKSRSIAEHYQYWFKDIKHNHPHALIVKTDNPLVSLIDGLFQLPELKVDAALFNKSFNGYHRTKQYFQLVNLKLSMD